MISKLPGVGSPLMQSTLKHAEKHLVYAGIFSAFLNLLYLAPTLYMLVVYDRVMATDGRMTLLLVTLVLFFALGTLGVLDWVRSRLLVRLSARMERVMAADILGTVIGDPMIPHVRRTQAVRDFDAYRQAMGGSVVLALLDAPWTPVFLLAAFLLHPMVGLLTLGSIAVLAGLAWLNEKVTAPGLSAASEMAAATYARQDYTSASAETVRALGMVRPLVARHVEERSQMIGLQTEASFASGGLVSFTKFARLAMQSCALGLGAWLAINHQISAGAVIAASLLVTRALAPVEQIVAGWKGFVQTRAARDRLDLVLKHGAAQRKSTQLPAARGELTFEGVVAGPPESPQPSIFDVSFQLPAGQVMAVVGPSGAGKSTLIRMAAGAGAPLRGVVRLDGASYLDWPNERLARFVGYLPQDFVLFPGTIKDNISRFARYAGTDIDTVDRQAVAAAQLTGAHEMILHLPQGYDTEVGPNGAGLSAGQRQRIALARAFYGDPSLLVLDEPNAHLDSEGELALGQALQQARQRGVTVLMVVHHGAILRQADHVAIIKDGRIQGIGPMDRMVRVAPAPDAPPQPERVAAEPETVAASAMPPAAPVQTPPPEAAPAAPAAARGMSPMDAMLSQLRARA